MDASLFRSFKYRNYRLFFTGQLVSVIGTWLQITAMPWLVYRLTGSSFLLGALGFLSQIFILILAPFAGAVTDHYDRKKIIMATQSLSMLQAFVLAALTLTGRLQIWHLVALSAFLGMVNALDMTARQSFVVEMVGKEDLMNAIGLNSMIFNAARLVGPALAGVLIAAVGEGTCFLLNAISFLAVLGAMYFIRLLPRATGAGPEESIGSKFAAGLTYLRSLPRLAALMALLSFTGLAAAFPMVLMPVFVKDVFHLGASGLGIFMSALGIGAFAGTLRIASQRSAVGLEKTIFVSAAATGLLVVGFSLVRNIPAACVLLALTGYCAVQQMGLTNTLVQTTISDEMRGRVTGFFIMAFMGLAPVGSLIAGTLAHHIGAPHTVALGGAVALGAAAVLGKTVFTTDELQTA